MSFDAIVIGSGMSGGFAAKELCERGLKVLVLERGKKIDPATDYTDHLLPWEFPLNNRVPEEEVARDYPVPKNMSLDEAQTLLARLQRDGYLHMAQPEPAPAAGPVSEWAKLLW